MQTLLRLLDCKLSTDRQDATFVRWAFLIAGGALIPLGLRAATRFTESNDQLVIAVLVVAIVALQFVMMGLLAPRVMLRNDA